jgi:hypothetical protein
MNAAILLAAALATADAPAVEVDMSVEDVTELQGAWEVDAITVDGHDVTRDFRGDSWTFAGDVVRGTPGGPWRIAAGATRLDRVTGSGQVLPGNYRIEGDELVWTWQEDSLAYRCAFRRVPQ